MKMANANINTEDDFMSDCNSHPSNDGCDKDKESGMIENNTLNNVKKVIGIMSGKVGVGKSTIWSRRSIRVTRGKVKIKKGMISF